MMGTLPEYIQETIAPLAYLLIAYEWAGGEGGALRAQQLAQRLEVEAAPTSGAQAWERYNQACAQMHQRERRTADAGGVLPYAQICAALALSPFERMALAFAIAMEMEPRYRDVIVQMAGGLSLGLLLRLFSGSVQESIALHREWLARRDVLGLLFVSGGVQDGVSLQSTAQRFLLGLDIVPKEMEHFAAGDPVGEPWVECAAPDALQRAWTGEPAPAVVLLYGEKSVGKKYQIKRFAARQGCSVLFVPSAQCVWTQAQGEELGRLLAFTGSVLCLCDLPLEGAAQMIGAARRTIGPRTLLVTSEAALRGVEDLLPIEVPSPHYAQRLALWQRHASALHEEGAHGRFASQYAFTAGQIAAAARLAEQMAVMRGEERSAQKTLHEACVAQLPATLGNGARPVSVAYTWADIVLPAEQMRLLRHVCDQVRCRDVVYSAWGFARSLAYGRGVRALFSGPPGTGKTMAAQIIASELDRQLFRVDASALVSKYIGETEKNIDELFRQAADNAGVLFFDEADALFGKRGEQQDSHDRYANMQTAFLLQRFEDFDGVVILASNFVSNFDPAFLRRIQNRIDFPVPTKLERKRIWDGMIMDTAPFGEDVDTAFLAQQFELSGSAIKNITIQAAFFAAAQGEAIGMAQLLGALVMEYAKTDKIIARHEFEQYGHLLPD